MVGICADGSCLPPVICTDDKNCPAITFDDGWVLKVKSSKGSGIDVTKRIFDRLKDYLQDEPYILMDPLHAHTNKEVVEILEEWRATPLIFPAGTGKLLDPVDNSFNAPLKARYGLKEKRNHTEMITAIHKSYYEVTDTAIAKYWAHIGYTNHKDLVEVVDKLIFQGYGRGAIDEATQNRCVEMYLKWEKNARDLWEHGIAPSEPPRDLPDTELDGHYWHAYQV